MASNLRRQRQRQNKREDRARATEWWSPRLVGKRIAAVQIGRSPHPYAIVFSDGSAVRFSVNAEGKLHSAYQPSPQRHPGVPAPDLRYGTETKGADPT